jgi:signal recognition particle GTPase
MDIDVMVRYCVQIPIFEKGYEKDPAVVAREAIQEASRNKSDVVLVDTAGRMQVSRPAKWCCFKFFLCLYRKM